MSAIKIQPEKEFYTWEQFDEDCRKIAEWSRRFEFKNIFGIPRGGLVVAVRLSHLFDVPLVLTQEEIGPRTLVVDDICDTGRTLKKLMQETQVLSYVKIATLWRNRESCITPHFWCREKTNWVIFPWETTETSRYDLTSHKSC